MSDKNQSNDNASIALQKFKENKYDECIKHLDELPDNLKEDRRVAFNKLVAEFYKSDLKNVDKFKDGLLKLFDPKATYPKFNIKLIKSPADAALFYSCAVMLYHSRHYSQAQEILEKLFTLKDQITDSKLETSIILLLLEVCLCRRLPDKFTQYFDQTSSGLQKKNSEITDMVKKMRFRASLMCRKQANPPTNVKTIDWLFLNSHQLYVNGDYDSAMRSMAQCQNIAESQGNNNSSFDFRPPSKNNMAVIYSAFKKHHMAAKCFQEAIKTHSKDLKNDKTKKLAMEKDRPLYIYNLGIALMRANRHEDAFESLIEAVRNFPNNPRLWFRLAECCVAHFIKHNKQDPVVYKIGSGPHTKLIPGPLNKERYSVAVDSFAIPSITMEFAALCLLNAITLLPPKDPPADVEQCFCQAPPGYPLNYKQYCNLRCSVLLLYSFVLLRLSDPSTALYYCNLLLARPANPWQKALAHMYMAEALIGLDRVSEAIDHLNPTVIHDIATKISPSAQEWLGVAVWLNGAVCHVVKGDLHTARNILLQINSPKALQLQLYLETVAGNIENCRVLLRKFKLQA